MDKQSKYLRVTLTPVLFYMNSHSHIFFTFFYFIPGLINDQEKAAATMNAANMGPNEVLMNTQIR